MGGNKSLNNVPHNTKFKFIRERTLESI